MKNISNQIQYTTYTVVNLLIAYNIGKSIGIIFYLLAIITAIIATYYYFKVISKE